MCVNHYYRRQNVELKKIEYTFSANINLENSWVQKKFFFFNLSACNPCIENIKRFLFIV